MTSHSLRPIPVEGEYHLSTNDLCIHGEIVPGVADKIRATSLLMDLPPRLFGLILDIPGTSFNMVSLPSRLEHLLVFLADGVDLFP
jgi:hypothetical protein